MKRLLSVLTAVVLMLTLTLPALAAAETRERPNGGAFEIKNVMDYAQAYGIRGSSDLTRIPLKLDIGNDMSTDLVVTIEPKALTALATSGILNFTVSGRFIRTSDGITVSVYGLSGSFEYDGSDTTITGKSSYHRSAMDKWTGTSKTSTDKVEPYSISVLKGDYVLYYDGQQSSTAWIKIAVSENGVYSVGGDYVSYQVN